MARIDALAEALAAGEKPKGRREFDGAPDCARAKAPLDCLNDLSRYFGSSLPLAPHRPVQADLAALAFYDVESPIFDDAGPFFDVIGSGKGAGNDAFRMASANRLRKAIENFPVAANSEVDSRAFLGIVGKTVLGACKSYALLGEGAPLESLPPDLHPDTSPCVARDLQRPLGPGATFGKGVPRATAAADVLVRGLANAIRNGLPRMQKGEAVTRAALKEIDERLARFAVAAAP